MEIVKVKLSEVYPDPKNARSHDSHNLEVIKNSLKKYGQYRPLVVQKSNMTIRVGNGLYQVLVNEKYEEADAVILDLTDEEATALSIMDNKSSDMSIFNEQQLAEAIQSLPEELLTITGFTDLELAKYVESAMDEITLPETNTPIDETAMAVTKCECPKCGFKW